MPAYEFACPDCGARHERELPVAEAGSAPACPVCSAPSRRVYTMPRLLFKADPSDVRPVWHNHDGYRHQHAPRRGRHKLPGEEH